MRKELKFAIWFGGLLLILFMYALVEGSKETAYQIIDILMYLYIAAAVLTMGEGIYKWIKKPFPKKEETIK